MERLGEDEIFSIFERISNKEDKKSFALVCKIFLRVACFHLRSLHTKSPDLLFDLLTVSPKMLTFECHAQISNNHMKLIAQSCPNIECLNLYKLHPDPDKLEFDDLGLVSIANACGHLVEVNLAGRLHFKEIGIGSLVRLCKNLRELDLINCINVTDKSLKMIGAATRLKNLDLRGCEMITDLGLEYLANGNLRNCLEILYLRSCDSITDNGIIHLRKLVSLRILSLSNGGANVTDYGVVALCELPNLEKLYLFILINITDISLIEIGSKCLQMRVLSLMGCKRITNTGLLAFHGHQKLNGLIIFSSYNFSLEDVKPIVMSCPNLKFLHLSRSMEKPMPKEYNEYINANTHRCRISWGWPSFQ